jgi:hypothetical protein
MPFNLIQKCPQNGKMVDFGCDCLMNSINVNNEMALNDCNSCLEAELHKYIRSIATDFLKTIDKRWWLDEMEIFRRMLAKSNREYGYRIRYAAVSPNLPDIMETCE